MKNDKGCCFLIPSWISIVPAWLGGTLLIISSIWSGFEVGFIGLICMAPFIANCFVSKVWIRIIMMITYMVFATGWLFIIAIISQGGIGGEGPGKTAFERDEDNRWTLINAIWFLIINLWILVGMGYYVADASKSTTGEQGEYDQV